MFCKNCNTRLKAPQAAVLSDGIYRKRVCPCCNWSAYTYEQFTDRKMEAKAAISKYRNEACNKWNRKRRGELEANG